MLKLLCNRYFNECCHPFAEIGFVLLDASFFSYISV